MFITVNIILFIWFDHIKLALIKQLKKLSGWSSINNDAFIEVIFNFKFWILILDDLLLHLYYLLAIFVRCFLFLLDLLSRWILTFLNFYQFETWRTVFAY
jgi:hypothetical protein